MLPIRRTAQWCLVAIFLFVRPAAAPPSAELVYFASGRVMPIIGHSFEGGSVVLRLRSGGEVVCDPRLIDRIEPDAVTALAPVVAAVVVKPRLPAKPYAELVERASARHGIDPRLVHALIEVESGYRANAESPKGAMGLMQLMPATAQRYAVGNPFDPQANIEAGARHLRTLLDEFGTKGALAAYNAGEGTVRRFQGIPPYPETRRYVSRVLELVDSANDD